MIALKKILVATDFSKPWSRPKADALVAVTKAGYARCTHDA
jgi:hypothetical protein